MYSKEKKIKQVTYIMGLIETFDNARKSAAERSAKNKVNTFSYFAMKATIRIPVCRKAFLSLYGVTN